MSAAARFWEVSWPRRCLHVPMAWFLRLDSALVHGGTENQEVNDEYANGQLVAQANRSWKGSDLGAGRGFAALDCAGGNRCRRGDHLASDRQSQVQKRISHRQGRDEHLHPA